MAAPAFAVFSSVINDSQVIPFKNTNDFLFYLIPVIITVVTIYLHKKTMPKRM